jgi:hypothetical protein
MSKIQNDQALRDALLALAPDRQRLLGARFAQSISHLAKDERIQRAIETALRTTATPGELDDAFKAAKGYATRTYTDCGKDTDWLAQADHFVAVAIAAALTPDRGAEVIPQANRGERQNAAWKAAVQARMAVNCAMMEFEGVTETSETQRQYAIANEFLGLC